MAAEQALQNNLAANLEPLDLLAFKLRKTQKLLLGVVIASALALILATIALTLYLVGKSRIERSEYQIEEFRSQLALQASSASEQTARAEQATLEIRAAVAEMESRLSELDINDPENVIIKVQRILIRQERDYRDFLVDLERSMHDIQKMIPHSRGWWDSYSEEMQESIKLSEARENYLLTLREN